MNFLTKTRLLIAAVVVLSAIVLATIGTFGFHYARMRSESPRHTRSPHEPGQFMARQLKLSPSQVEQFTTLRNAFHAQSGEITRELRQISITIIDEASKEHPDTSILDSLAEKYGNLQTQNKQIMVKHLLEVKSHLTPEQRIKFMSLMHRVRGKETFEDVRHWNRLQKHKARPRSN